MSELNVLLHFCFKYPWSCNSRAEQVRRSDRLRENGVFKCSAIRFPSSCKAAWARESPIGGLRPGAARCASLEEWSRGESNPRPVTVGVPPLRVCSMIASRAAGDHRQPPVRARIRCHLADAPGSSTRRPARESSFPALSGVGRRTHGLVRPREHNRGWQLLIVRAFSEASTPLDAPRHTYSARSIPIGPTCQRTIYSTRGDAWNPLHAVSRGSTPLAAAHAPPSRRPKDNARRENPGGRVLRARLDRISGDDASRPGRPARARPARRAPESRARSPRSRGSNRR